MISIKNYASSKGVSPQSIYQHIKRYAAELDPHVIKENGVKNLDDYAVKFLDEKIEGDSIVVIDTQKDDEIKKLQQENKNLLYKLTSVQDKVIVQSNQIIELQRMLIEEKPKKKSLWKFWQPSTHEE